MRLTCIDSRIIAWDNGDDKDAHGIQLGVQDCISKGKKQQGVYRMKNKLYQIYSNFRSEKGQGGLIQFLIGAIIVAVLLYVLLVVIKALFFS